MNDKHDRLMELMAMRVAGTLSEAEARELSEHLLATGPGEEKRLESALAAAANALALEETADGEAMPPGLKTRLADDAERFFDAPQTAATVAKLEPRREQNTARRAPRPAFAWLGWAAAAMLLVAVVVDRREDTPTASPGFVTTSGADPSTETGVASTLTPPALQQPDAVVDRARMMLEAPDAVVLAWAPQDTEAFAGVRGDIVWSDERQRGYLRLAGMPVNDPAQAQYQLWIVDPERDERPVDGGVFDINARGEVVIPVDAKLRVSEPVAFAITREKPGGVVVSEGPLLVVASAG